MIQTMKMKLLTLVSAALLASCATAPNGDTVSVRLIAFNDLHGNLEAANLSLPWPDPANKDKALRLSAGGAANLAGLVQSLRAGAKNSLVISSGDAIGGTPLISALFRHESTIDVMNRIGVDLAIPGNHEFDAGAVELQRVLKGGCAANAPEANVVSCGVPAAGAYAGAKFPMFAANILTTGGAHYMPPSVVREVDGVKIGFIGAVTESTPFIVVPSGVAGLKFTDEAEAINKEAATLKAQGVQALVAVIHEGGNTGTPGLPLEWNDVGCPKPTGAIFDIARKLTQDVDIIFSAHTHQGYRCVLQGDGRPIMQATALGRGVSVADVVIDRKTGDIDRAKTTHRNLPVFNDKSDATLRASIINNEPAPFAQALLDAKPVAAVAERVALYAQAAAPRAQKVVGRIGGAFERVAKTDASAGRLVADAQWLATRAPDRGGAQFALMNPGGVRSDLRCSSTPPCTITYGDAFTMQPFGNALTVMTLSGADIKQMLEDQQRPGRDGASFLIPSSSLTYTWNAKAAHGQRVVDLKVAGQAIEPGRDYRFTVNSFLADGGDGVSALTKGRNRLGGELDLDALIAHLQTTPSPDPAPRITWLE
jgi:5'-nucleotidase